MKSDEDAVAFMTELRDHMQDWQMRLQEREADWKKNWPGYPDDMPDEEFYPQLTLALGLKRVSATVEWCEESIARIRARQAN